MFSNRLPSDTAPNALSRRLAALANQRAGFTDLTESNPTRAGLPYAADLLRGLADARALRYEPAPFGLPAARAAVAADYARRRVHVEPSQVVLTSSTSEAYSWLFKLLCSPGDEVLAPRPSYPLFEHLTRLEGVGVRPYDLEYHARWEIDLSSVARAVTPRTRALLVVSPNNPTGSYLKRRELHALEEICAARSLVLVVDEVFADYAIDPPSDCSTDVAAQAHVLTFSLGGLSKSVGLPQLKLGWMLAGGPPQERAAALSALELIADSYLSVSTPVQLAAADLLARGAAIRDGILSRVRGNFLVLRDLVPSAPGCDLLACEGGWYAVIRVPATRGEEDLVLDLLDRERILVHPGYFFDFPREAYLVISLLPPPEVFADAAARMLQFASTAP